MDISIIIVNYNVKEYIISCIQSIYKHSISDYSFEIIIIDNNSKDGSVEKLKKEFPKVLLIENNHNVGFSIAVNQGVKKCIGKFVLILNPDTLFIEDSLKKLINIANGQGRFGVIGPALISNKGTIQQSYWRDPSIINTMLSIAHLDLINYKKNYRDKKFDNISKVDTISGGAFFLSREVFNQLGGFNEKLFWMEDIDFCIRLKKMGYNTYYFPLTKIIHFIGKSSESNYKVAISNQLLSKIKFFRIHHSKLSANIVLFSVLFVSLIKLTMMLFITPFSLLYRKKIVGYLYTIRSVFNNYLA